MGLLDINFAEQDFCTFDSFFTLEQCQCCQLYWDTGLPSSSSWLFHKQHCAGDKLTSIMTNCPIIMDHHNRPRLDKDYLMAEFYDKILPDSQKSLAPRSELEWSISSSGDKIYYTLLSSEYIEFDNGYRTRQIVNITLRKKN